jgi:hypothetical protein
MAQLTTLGTPAAAVHMKTVVLVKKETLEQAALPIKVEQVQVTVVAAAAVLAVQVQIASAVQLEA